MYFDPAREFKHADKHVSLIGKFFVSDFERRAKGSGNVTQFFLSIRGWKVNRAGVDYPVQLDKHSCGIWVAYVAFASAAGSSPLNVASQLAIRKKMFEFIYLESGLPKLQLNQKDRREGSKAREEWVKAGANVKRYRDLRRRIDSACAKKLLPAIDGAQNQNEVIVLSDNEVEHGDVVMTDDMEVITKGDTTMTDRMEVTTVNAAEDNSMDSMHS